MVERKLDSYKLLDLTRRPMPRAAKNIGQWLDILRVMSWIAIITNIFLLVNTDFFQKLEIQGLGCSSTLIFIFIEHFVFIVKSLFGYVIPEMKSKASNHLARQRFVGHMLLAKLDKQ